MMEDSKLEKYQMEAAKTAKLEFKNELEKILFKTWITIGDSEFGIDKKDIRNYIIQDAEDEEERKQMLDQLKEISEDRLFHIFSIADFD